MSSTKNNTNYTPVIGLEVHVELKTKSKMFCGCSTDYFGKEPNTHTCPVCLGLPGTLPVPNRKAIEWCVMIGMALNCEVLKVSEFDRKNYFYPDLPKGYQISQHAQPFAQNGYILLSNKKIRIRSVHMEEDTGKLMHATVNGEKVSLIDFNRSGVPLVEIVTEPDFENAAQVKEYLQKLQLIIRYVGVSDADMEKGEMRMEPNISLREVKAQDLPNYKVEVKNINSIKFVEKAINYELKRQEDILKTGILPAQETRGWDENRQKTFSQRVKGESADYRYFPDPDIPPIRWSDEKLSSLRGLLPELQDEKIARFEKVYSLPYYDAEILTREQELADFFEETVKACQSKYHDISPKTIANWIINRRADAKQTTPIQLAQAIHSSMQTVQVDEDEINKVIQKVLRENVKAVEDFKKGKQASLQFLLGQVMRQMGKKVDVTVVRGAIERSLK
jgi:aspartyl-tRNA(Asn)/glutamyl-tRNA(Gln) amidotransferase subunit B